MKLHAHTDGASRGNPGLAAIGCVIGGDGFVLEEFGRTIGNATNNIAEYKACLAALERMSEMHATKVEIFTVSELLVRQINGEYRVKNPGLKPLYEQVMAILGTFDSWRVTHVPRAWNAEADRLANKALDDAKRSGR